MLWRIGLISLALTTLLGCSAPIGQSYFKRALEKENRKDYQGAIADYTEVIRLNPEDADAFYYRGLAKYKLGDYQSAIIDYTEVIRLNPNYCHAVSQNRGLAKEALEDKQGGINDYYFHGCY